MNKLLYFPLVIFLVIVLVNQVYIHRGESDLLSGISLSNTQNINGSGNIYENGTATEVGIEESQLSLDIDFVTGFLAVIIGIAILGAVLGITFLGSGLSERTQKIILISAVSLGLWSMFSLLTYNIITGIQSPFGVLLWLSFTFVFMIGFFKEINGGQ